MIHRLNTLTRRLAVAAAFIALGLAASAPAAQAQCSPEDCLVAETTGFSNSPEPQFTAEKRQWDDYRYFHIRSGTLRAEFKYRVEYHGWRDKCVYEWAVKNESSVTVRVSYREPDEDFRSTHTLDPDESNWAGIYSHDGQCQGSLRSKLKSLQIERYTF